jgi:hypothetical protein
MMEKHVAAAEAQKKAKANAECQMPIKGGHSQ